MLIKLNFDNIDELFIEQKPILLVCLQHDRANKKDLEILEKISETFSESIKICIASLDSMKAVIEAYDVKGTPTFLLLKDGKEHNRILGEVDSNLLTKAILSLLSSIGKKTISKVSL
ncbi:MAG: thioredoxin family protein [Desulfobacterales bacterium]|nr:thioredoxin family protein [Desulfobacterales bacterium]MBF0397475.1 thioredoxin family protein [Desulfobacterales bacterium]